MSVQYRPEVGSISLTPDFAQIFGSDACMKLKFHQGSPISPLSPQESAVQSDSIYYFAPSASSSQSENCFDNKPFRQYCSDMSFNGFSAMANNPSFHRISNQFYAQNVGFSNYSARFVDQASDAVIQSLNMKNQAIAAKLQELENALLGPDEEEEMGMDWSKAVDDFLNQNETTQLQIFDADFMPDLEKREEESSLPLQHGAEILDNMNSPEQLLVLCAEAISNNEAGFANHVMGRLNKVVSIYGDPIQRLAAYMREGLVAKMHSTGKGLCSSLTNRGAGVGAPGYGDDLHSSMQILHEICPYFKFGYMAANGAIAEAFKDENRVHIIDFEIGQGTQWITLIQALATRPGGPPSVKITGISSPELAMASKTGDFYALGQRLKKLAQSVGVPLQYHALNIKLSDVQPWMIKVSAGEAIAVNFALQLHHLPDESVCVTNPRDKLLRMVKGLNPKVVTLVEQELNTNTAPFLPRFTETLSYYAAVFESLDAALPRESKERVKMEQICLARDIVNVIACEGAERIERYELIGKWRARMKMAGFQPYPLSSYVNQTIKSLLESYCNKYRLKEDGGALHLGWLNRVLIVASAWH